jgi:Bacterial alpha-L-rhamnosidase 6 hairpin glycosidase domain
VLAIIPFLSSLQDVQKPKALLFSFLKRVFGGESPFFASSSPSGLRSSSDFLFLPCSNPYAVKKGATTIWENWDGIDEEGNPHHSLNHYSYGAIGNWLYQVVAGIAPRVPGYRHTLFQPQQGMCDEQRFCQYGVTIGNGVKHTPSYGCASQAASLEGMKGL